MTSETERTYEQYIEYFYQTTPLRDIEHGALPLIREDWEKAQENAKKMEISSYLD